jgi:predicted PurR-regulated permease PerM
MGQNRKNMLGDWLRKSGPNLMIVLIGILFFTSIEHFNVVSAVVGKVFSVCMPFIAGAFIAFLLDGPARWFEKRFHWNRPLAVTVVVLLATLLIFLMFWGLLPQLVDSITQLVRQIPDYLKSLNGLVDWVGKKYSVDTTGAKEWLGSYSNVITQTADWVSEALPQIVNYSIQIGKGVLHAVEAIMASIYILLSKQTLMRQMKKLNYAIFPLPIAKKFSRIFHHTCRAFIGFFNGKIIDSAIIGVMSFVILSVLGMPYVILLSVVIGVTNIIPFFGPFIGAIPNAMILFIIDPIKAFEYIIFTLIIQQFDGNVLGPRILGDSIGLPPLWVLFSIVVAGGLFGFAGMLLGVPIFAVLYTMVREWTHDRLEEKNIIENEDQLEPGTCVDPEQAATAAPPSGRN